MIQLINTPEQTNRYIPKATEKTFEAEVWIKDFPQLVNIWIAYQRERNRIVIIGCETGITNAPEERIKELVEEQFPDRVVVWECEIY